MTATNRVQVAIVRESTAGVTPTTPRMRRMRITSVTPSLMPQYVESEEIRSDRMSGDPIRTITEANPSVGFELSYPVDESPLSEIFRSAFWRAWENTVQRDNDGVADSVITQVTGATGVVTVASAAAFVAGHLVRFSGFGQADNNGLFRCTTGSATAPAFADQGLVDESAPAAAARMKVVGFQAADSDIEAVADGLTSTLLDFTTITGLAVGKWIKIGGSGSSYRFDTAANNGWARIVAIAQNKITLDNLPSGWATDDGADVTLRVFFGDRIRNGVDPTSFTMEVGYLGQSTPTYIVDRGLHVNTLQMSLTSRAKVTGTAAMIGMGGSQSTTALDASPDAVTSGQVMAAHAHVGRLAEAGSVLSNPNWARALEFTINNNLRAIDSVDESSPVAVREGECQVTGRVETYFGSNALLAKFYAGTPSSINARVTRDNQALIWQFPRIVYRGGGDPNVPGENQDVMLPLEWQASRDEATDAHVLLDRVEYYED